MGVLLLAVISALTFSVDSSHSTPDPTEKLRTAPSLQSQDTSDDSDLDLTVISTTGFEHEAHRQATPEAHLQGARIVKELLTSTKTAFGSFSEKDIRIALQSVYRVLSDAKYTFETINEANEFMFTTLDSAMEQMKVTLTADEMTVMGVVMKKGLPVVPPQATADLACGACTAAAQCDCTSGCANWPSEGSCFAATCDEADADSLDNDTPTGAVNTPTPFCWSCVRVYNSVKCDSATTPELEKQRAEEEARLAKEKAEEDAKAKAKAEADEKARKENHEEAGISTGPGIPTGTV